MNPMTSRFKLTSLHSRNKLEIRFVKMPEGWHCVFLRQGNVLMVSTVYPEFSVLLPKMRTLIQSLQDKNFTLSRSDGKSVSLWQG